MHLLGSHKATIINNDKSSKARQQQQWNALLLSAKIHDKRMGRREGFWWRYMYLYRERIRREDYASAAGFCATRTGNYINKFLEPERGDGDGGKNNEKNAMQSQLLQFYPCKCVCVCMRSLHTYTYAYACTSYGNRKCCWCLKSKYNKAFSSCHEHLLAYMHKYFPAENATCVWKTLLGGGWRVEYTTRWPSEEYEHNNK